MDNNRLAPIILFVYNRPDHTEKTLNALKENKYIEESELYVYSDGIKDEADENNKSKILQVRNLVRQIDWCKKLHVIESDFNIGLAKSIINGVSSVVKLFGKVIVLEDDIVTSPAFLTYMNKSLCYYENRKSVFSISGYLYPQSKFKVPDDYDYDVFVSVRNSSWGWGIWEDRWRLIDWDTKNFSSICSSPEMIKAFNRGGDDVFELLRMFKDDKLSIWSIQSTLAQFENHLITIFPVKSYVDNIGLDGTGENCTEYKSLQNPSLNLNEDIRFLKVLYQDRRLINSYYNVNCKDKRSFWKKIINKACRFLGRNNIFVLKRKIYM
jgi:Glycosyl transferase family 2